MAHAWEAGGETADQCPTTIGSAAWIPRVKASEAQELQCVYLFTPGVMFDVNYEILPDRFTIRITCM